MMHNDDLVRLTGTSSVDMCGVIAMKQDDDLGGTTLHIGSRGVHVFVALTIDEIVEISDAHWKEQNGEPAPRGPAEGSVLAGQIKAST